MEKKTPWQNRIVGHGEKPAKEFLANPFNWKIHTALQERALEGSLDILGWIDEVIENVRTGRLLDGHDRIVLALRRGENTPVPYKQVDLSEDEEKQALALLDPIIALAQTDSGKLDELLREINSDDERIQEFLSNLAEKEGITGSPPSLDNLEDEFGEPEADDFWPVISIKVAPQIYQRWQELMAKASAESESEKFELLLAAVDEELL
jgi:hypothetical protein